METIADIHSLCLLFCIFMSVFLRDALDNLFPLSSDFDFQESWALSLWVSLSLSVLLFVTTTKIIYRCTVFASTVLGKIQGDGRKFLDRFKSYFGSQISSQSLNEVHIYRLQPKSATNGDFFHIFLSLIVSSRRHGLQMANEADEVLLGRRPR